MQSHISHQQAEDIAEVAAQKAIKNTFALLGIDLDKFESVQEFRQDIQFARSLRHGKAMVVGRAALTFVTIATGAALISFWDYVKMIVTSLLR